MAKAPDDRLPTDRVPTWTEFVAAARRRAIAADLADMAGDAATNAGLLLKGARDEGWDVVVPGTGYDMDGGGAAARSLMVIGGPRGALDEAVLVVPDGAPDAPEPTVPAFLFGVADAPWDEAENLNEVTFHCDPSEEPSFSTFTIDLVLAEIGWGFPDFREPTHGWASWIGDELIVAWAEPGNDDQGAARRTIEGVGDRAVSQAFWVRLARTIALARGVDDGL